MDISNGYLSFGESLTGKVYKDSLTEKDEASSCNTSDCSFEMDPDDELKGIRLCSIDELFASPPAISASDDKNSNVDENTSIDLSNHKDFFSSDSPAHELSDSNSSSPKNSSLCWICQENEPKYKCPQCMKRTCSLACVKLHKEKLSCEGKRNKTEYIQKDSFTETNFLSDYRFLEEVNRCVSKRNHFPRPYFKSKGMKLLANKAYAMKINLKILPTTFKRRKENSTFYCFKNRQFLWHVEWIFVSCGLTLYDNRLPDNKSLIDAVNSFIHPITDNKRYDARLNDYTKTDDISFYMKKENTHANETQYYKLNAGDSLQSNLKGKTIVEYPTIFVALPKQTHIYELALYEDQS